MPVISTCQAATHALRALEATTLALVNPPWFDEELDTLGASYFASEGFDIVHHAPAALLSAQAEITPARLFDWIKSVAGNADAVFVAGNGQRAVGVIDALEDELGIAVLTANQVLLWRSLQAINADVHIDRYGKLMRDVGIG